VAFWVVIVLNFIVGYKRLEKYALCIFKVIVSRLRMPSGCVGRLQIGFQIKDYTASRPEEF
jgi:hypothetical protein